MKQMKDHIDEEYPELDWDRLSDALIVVTVWYVLVILFTLL